jgi:hypothetical protein
MAQCNIAFEYLLSSYYCVPISSATMKQSKVTGLIYDFNINNKLHHYKIVIQDALLTHVLYI